MTPTNPTPAQQGETLLPCPFCGSTNLNLSDGYDEDANWVVVCLVCRSSGTFSAIKAAAVARWNSRAAVTGPRSDVEVCEWEDNGNGFWLASCGDAYKVYPNDINVTGMHFCCFCGKSIKPVEFDPSSDGPRQRAATSSPAPAESAEPSLKELVLEVAMFLDQIANRDLDDNTFHVAGQLAFALRANIENHPLTATTKTHAAEDAVPALDCLVDGHIWKTEGNKTVCEHCGTGVEFGPAPTESTRVEGEQLADKTVKVDVKISKETGGAYADVRQAIESELAQIRQRLPRLPFICGHCNVQQYADGICGNCGEDALRTQPTTAAAPADNESD